MLWEKDPKKSNEFIRQLINKSAKEIEGINTCGLLDAEYAMSMYDTFTESFDETQEKEVFKNIEEPEDFTEVTNDDIYVEGRWMAADHRLAVSNSGVSDFSIIDIELIKQGCVFPDNDKLAWGGSKTGATHWHGRYKNDKNQLINYVAIFEMITDTAINGGKVTNEVIYNDYMGLDSTTFLQLKKQINGLDYGTVFNYCENKIEKKLEEEYAIVQNVSLKNNEKNRKLFLYGCAIHTITDAFAHAIVESDGSMLTHDEGADDTTYYHKRHKMATALTGYALLNLKHNMYSDGKEVEKAIMNYWDGNTKFRMANIKKYLNENGYVSAVPDSFQAIKN
ncbi:MAG: hypothetical protein J6A92_04120 [Lachnospiraceae bacterium]|nr:hypothetical protein [Lachnospiraceae bacterium]